MTDARDEMQRVDLLLSHYDADSKLREEGSLHSSLLERRAVSSVIASPPDLPG
jgi:hypothetical protein